MEDELIDQVIRQAFMNQYIYSGIQFDNYRDSQKLQEIAQQNTEMMLTAAKSRLIRYTDELLEKRIRKIIDESNGKVAAIIGNGEFTFVKIEEVKPNREGITE